MYQLTSDNNVVSIVENGGMISRNDTLAWQEYENWLTEGNTPLPYPGSLLPSLEDVKQNQIDYINEMCESAITGGFSSAALGQIHTYDSKLEDQINLIGAVIAAGAGVSVDYKCFDENGMKEWETHTPQQMQQVYMDGLVYKVTQLKKATYFKELIQAATTNEAVEAIQWQ